MRLADPFLKESYADYARQFGGEFWYSITPKAGGLTSPSASVIVFNTIMFNTSQDRRKPLTPLEQLLMDYVWSHPACTAEACRAGVADERPLKDSTIRTILRVLEAKGYATHRVEGRTYLYRAVETPRNIAVEAAQQLIERFCGGSVEEFLVGMVDNQVLEPKQLQRLAEKIAARKEKKA